MTTENGNGRFGKVAVVTGASRGLGRNMARHVAGAGMAVEDAIVIAQELEKVAWEVDEALRAFMERRWNRCRTVVENSLEIGRREQARRPPQEQTELVAATLPKLAEPI